MVDRLDAFLSFASRRNGFPLPSAPLALPASASLANGLNFLPINSDTRPVFDALDGIHQEFAVLDKLHTAQLIQCGGAARERVRAELERITAACHDCHTRLDAYQRATRQLDQQHRLNPADVRMRENILSFMEVCLMEAVRQVWEAQRAHEERLIDATARRVRVRFAGNDVSNPMDAAHALVLAKQLVETGNEDRLFSLARDELERVMRTRDAVLELEREMRDLLQLFSDLHFLVMEQHEKLVQVQENVEEAHTNIETGTEELREAKSHQKACCNAM